MTVTLRRLPHLERLKVIAEASVPTADGQSASLLVGLILERLLQPSVGVVKWGRRDRARRQRAGLQPRGARRGGPPGARFRPAG